MDIEQSFTKINKQIEPYKKNRRVITQNDLTKIVINLFDLIDNIYHNHKKSFMLSSNTKKRIMQKVINSSKDMKNAKTQKEINDNLDDRINTSTKILVDVIDRILYKMELIKVLVDENYSKIKKINGKSQ